MENDLICPNCHVALDEQQLLTHTWSVDTCPNCRAVVRKRERMHWQDRDAATREDVAAVNGWLSALAQGASEQGLSVRVQHQTADGLSREYRWEVTGVKAAGLPLPWLCTVEYDPDKPHVCELRLASNEYGWTFLDDPRPLFAACANQGVQAHASEMRRWVEWEGRRREVVWGARQLLATHPLPKGLFQAVVRRLDQAMREALVHLGEERPGSTAADANRQSRRG